MQEYILKISIQLKNCLKNILQWPDTNPSLNGTMIMIFQLMMMTTPTKQALLFQPVHPLRRQNFRPSKKKKSGFPELLKAPEDLLTELPSLSTTTFAAEGEIDKEFPNADKNKIKFIMDEKGRTRVGLISPKKPYYNLLTQIPGKSGEYRVNPQLPKEVLRALGESC